MGLMMMVVGVVVVAVVALHLKFFCLIQKQKQTHFTVMCEMAK